MTRLEQPFTAQEMLNTPGLFIQLYDTLHLDKNDSELLEAINEWANSHLERLLIKGRVPSRQLIELLHYSILSAKKDDCGGTLEANRESLKLFVKYQVYKPTLKELMLYF